MTNRGLTLLVGWIAAWSLNLAYAFPVHSPVPGGMAVVNLGPAVPPKPEVTFADQRVLVIANAGRWTALIGIPLTAKPGRQTIQVRRAERWQTLKLEIKPKDYPTQFIRLPKGQERYLAPSPAELARIECERKQIEDILATWTEREQLDLDFRLPIPGKIGSRFGLRRLFNGQPRQPHSGLDLIAPKGTPVRAPAAATVLATGDFFFTGQAIFLDHGQGLISAYFHLSRIDVQPGQTVQRGQVIGAVGQTGRVTGPHLHLNIYLNRTPVDPALFLRHF